MKNLHSALPYRESLFCGVYGFWAGLLLLGAVLAFLPAEQGFAATTGTGPADLITLQGAGANCSFGDAYSANNNTGCTGGATGLDTYYSYWIEVPPGTSELQVDIFDADIGAGPNHDVGRSGYNTAVRYTLHNPTGAIHPGFDASLAAGSCSGCDNNWATWGASPVLNPAPGYWEFRVDQSSAVTTGNDVNRLGVRAYDSSSNSSLNVFYYNSNMGPSISGGTQSTTNYPYVTSGCFIGQQNFDFDNNGGLSLTTRQGSTLAAFGLSGNGNWQNDSRIFESSDDSAEDYGVWTANISLTAGANYGNWLFYPEAGGSAAPPASRFALNDGRAFRSYLGTGTTGNPVGAPVKPYLAQWVRQNDPGGNPNEFTVTIRLINPTAFDITNAVVDAVVPSPVTYGGVRVGFPTHGSMAVEPGVGGSGALTWNPGTVAAGQTAVLAYNISVPDPNVVTIVTAGATSANATRASFDDETTTPFTTGGLCELRIGPALTQAVVTDFGASAHAGGVLLHWNTASEVGTLGFHVERRSSGGWERLNRGGLLPGLGLTDPQGGAYTYVDNEAAPGETLLYRLVELESKGNQRIHGPYEVTLETDGELIQTSAARPPYSVTAKTVAVATKVTSGGDQFAGMAEAPPGAVDGIRIGIRETGLYYLSATEVATRLNMAEASINTYIQQHQLILQSGGNEIAWLPADNGAGLYFYAEAIDSIYTRDNVLLLKIGPGSAMAAEDGENPASVSLATFVSEQHFEQDKKPVLVRAVRDYWFWGELANFTDNTTTPPTDYRQAEYSFQLHGVAGGAAELALELEGYSETEHAVNVQLNGVEIDDLNWDGQRAHTAQLAVPSGVLREGENTLTLLHPDIPGVVSWVYFNSFDVRYPRNLVVQNGALHFYTGTDTVATIDGLSGAAVRILRIDNPGRPVLMENISLEASGSGYRASFISGGEGRFILVEDGAVKAPAWLQGYVEPQLNIPANQADYLVVAPAELKDAAQALADYRASSGLITRVVTLKEIYLAFNHGVEDPAAIGWFIDYARDHWLVAPRYLALVGDSSYDHRHLLGGVRDDHKVPALFVGTPDGIFAADNLYGAMRGNAPRVAVGRIPVRTNQELLAYLAKLQAWESALVTDQLVQLVADNADPTAGDFPADSNNTLRPEVPAVLLAAQDVYLDATNPGKAHDDLLAALNDGRGLVNYLGHGGIDRLAEEGILTSGHVPDLANAQTPVMTALSCVVNRHALAGVDSLGEQLVVGTDAGAIAMWAPTGLSQNASAVGLNRALLQAVYTTGHPVLGDAIVAALQAYAPSNPVSHMPKVYTLLGDPAVKIRPGAVKSQRIINTSSNQSNDLAGGQVGTGGAMQCVGRRVKLSDKLFDQDRECAASSYLEAENTEVEAGINVRFCAPGIELKSGFRVRGSFSAGSGACTLSLK